MSSSSSTLIQKLSEKNIKLIDKIGEGTYGEIFIAEWNEQSQLVAVKIVTFESSNESIKNMFNREVYFSNKLKNHPNVLKLYDHFLIEDKSDDGEEFTIGVMIMEKMDVDLMDYILSKNSYISLTECRKIFSALVDVIGFLHSQSIAHCDIKPENVLLKLKEDRISKIKICDFGFTIQWQVDLRSSLSFGTNEYRSPELLRSLISNKTNQQSNNFNHQNSDNNNNNNNDNRVINVMNCDLMPALNDYKEQINYEKADVWSLGVTMFACFTGLFPFVFQSETNQLVKLDNFSFLSRHFNNPKNPFYSQFLQNAKIYDYSSHYSQSQQRRKPVNLMKYVNNVVYRGHEDDDDYAYYESEFGDLVDLFEGIFEPSPSLRFAITDVHTHRWFILHENNGMDPCNSSFYIRRCSVPRSMSIDDIENSAHNNNNNSNNITSSSNYPRKRRNSFSRIKGFINSHFK